MSLHVILGFSENGANAEPKAIYAGRSAEAARKAKEADTGSIYFMEYHNVEGLRKHNPRYVESTPAPSSDGEQIPVVDEPPVVRKRR